MKVNSIGNKIIFKNTNFNIATTKRDYIDSKTESLDYLSGALALGALTSEIIDTPVITNSKKQINKFSLGFLLASLIVIIISSIKKYNLSKEYDNIKENIYDTKNYA